MDGSIGRGKKQEFGRGRGRGGAAGGDFVADEHKQYYESNNRKKEGNRSRVGDSYGNYQGIFEGSKLIITSDDPNEWKTYQVIDRIEQARAKIDQDRKDRKCNFTYPITHTHHILPRYMTDNLISHLSYNQKKHLGQFLSIANFTNLTPVKQVQELCSLSSGIFLGPFEGDRTDHTASHRSERIYIYRIGTSNCIVDMRTEMFGNIECVMLERGKEIKEGKISISDKFSREEFKMISLCLKAAEEYHSKVYKQGEIDPYYVPFQKYKYGWKLGTRSLDDKAFYELVDSTDMECMKNIISIVRLNPKTLANHFLALEGKFSEYMVKSIKQRGRLSLRQIKEYTDAIIDRFKDLKSRNHFPQECSNIVEPMRKYLQSNKKSISKIADKDIATMGEKDIVYIYTQDYLNQFTRIDQEALANAFVGWDAKYNMWVEQSLIESGGYSQQDATKITNAINQKGSNELKNLVEPINRYMDDNSYTKHGEYAHGYVRMFTKMKSIDKLYIQTASEFFDNLGKLLQETTVAGFSREEANQLAKTIGIRAGILKAIGNRYQKEQIARTEEAIKLTGKNLEQSVLHLLQEHIKIEGMDLTYGQAAFQYLQDNGENLLETKDAIHQRGKLLSEHETEQLLEAIRLQYLKLTNEKKQELRKAFTDRTNQRDKTILEYVKDSLKDLREDIS